MCGIAGYSLANASSADRTLAAQALLAGIAERGSDAVGYAFRCGSEPVHIHKQRSGASALLDEIAVPDCASQALVHVRDYTKGHPTIAANNHPVRHGAVVGIHNGIIFNDEELLAEHGIERADPEMSVDSEVIFALAESSDSTARAFEQLHGSMATAWLDERAARAALRRARRRPAALARPRSQRALLRLDTRRTRWSSSGRSATACARASSRRDGSSPCATARSAHTYRFSPDRSFTEESLPSVRAPHEGAKSLQRLYAIAGVAA